MHFKPLLGLVIVAITAQLTIAAKDSTATVTISPNDQREYRAITLDNTIDVVLVSDPSTDKSGVALSVGVGYYFDPLNQQGMAHYLEHMLFLGTEKYPDTNEYDEFISANGGTKNAYTSTDVTNYLLSINNDAYDEGLDRFSDFFKAPKLYPEYTEKEINAVNAEWSISRENDWRAQWTLKRSFFGEHASNRFTTGNLETLGDKEDSKLHPDTLVFYDKYYSANIMKVAMISNLSLDEMEKLARKHFSSIKNKNIPDPVITDKIEPIGTKRVYYKPNRDVKQIVLDFTIENNMDQFAYKPNNFIGYLLGSEMPGTPAFILKEMGLISSLNAGAFENLYGNYGQFGVTISLTDKGMQQREFIVATVMQYLDKIRESGVDKKYFKEIQTSLSNQFRFLEKTNEFQYVTGLAAAMQDYPLEHIIDSPYYYKSFNKDLIEESLAQLIPENLLVWYVSQQEKTDKSLHFYAGEYRKEDISKEEIASWSAPSKLAMTLPDVNRMLPENFELYTEASSADDKPEMVYDTKGVQIMNYASRYFANQPRGVTRILINNPDKQTSPEAAVMQSIWTSLFNLQQSALVTEASIAGMSLSISAGNGLILNLSGFTDKQDLLLETAFSKLMVDVTEENFNQAIERYVRGISNQGKQPAFRQAINKFYALRGSGNYESETLIETANSLNHNDFKKFMKNVMDNNTIRAFTFGNYSAKDVEALADRIEAMLPDDRRVTNYTKNKFWLPEKGKTLVYRSDVNVDDVAVIDMFIHPVPGYKSKAIGGILATHYQTEVFNTLRTEEQLAYAVFGFSSSVDEYATLGMLIQTPVKNPKEMQERFNAFHGEYAKSLDGLTEEAFQTLKASRLTNLRQDPKNLSEEVNPLLSDWTSEKLDFDSREKLIAATEQVNLADLKQFYQETMGNKDAARMSIQYRGNKFADQPYFEFDNEVVVDDVAKFHATTKHQADSAE